MNRKKLIAWAAGIIGVGAIVWLLWPSDAQAAESELPALPPHEPEPEPAGGEQDALPPTAIGRAYQYIVGSHPGDSKGLTAICERLYGEAWPAIWIYDLNRTRIGGNINLIRAGQELWFPDDAALANLSNALIAEFKARYAQLVADYKAACSGSNYPADLANALRQDCSVDAIIPVSEIVSTPSVAPLVFTITPR